MKAGICQSLFEVTERILAGAPSTLEVGNFLAFLKPSEVPEAITQEPGLLAPSIPSGDILDAYIAAIAETLASRADVPPPTWTEAPGRFLSQAHYPSKSRRLNELLLSETPASFRRRGLITSSNVMDVA